MRDTVRRAPVSPRLARAWSSYVALMVSRGLESAHYWRIELRRGEVWIVVDTAGLESRTRLATTTTLATQLLERQTTDLAA